MTRHQGSNLKQERDVAMQSDHSRLLAHDALEPHNERLVRPSDLYPHLPDDVKEALDSASTAYDARGHAIGNADQMADAALLAHVYSHVPTWL